jgi:hypothetical protein
MTDDSFHVESVYSWSCCEVEKSYTLDSVFSFVALPKEEECDDFSLAMFYVGQSKEEESKEEETSRPCEMRVEANVKELGYLLAMVTGAGAQILHT